MSRRRVCMFTISQCCKTFCAYRNSTIKFYPLLSFGRNKSTVNPEMLRVMERIGLKRRNASKFLSENVAVSKIPSFVLEKTILELKRIGITDKDIYKYPKILTIPSSVLKHNSMMFEEGGFVNVTAQVLIRFLRVVNLNMYVLKGHGLLAPEDDRNCAQHFLSYMEQFLPDVEQLEVKVFDHPTTTFKTVYTEVMRYYLKHRLGISSNFVRRDYPPQRQFYCSFRLIERTLNILESEYDVTIQKFPENELLCIDPDYILEMANTFPFIGTVEFKDVAKIFPHIFLIDIENISYIIHYLKEFEIPLEFILKCPKILPLDHRTVRERLVRLYSVPEFSVLRTNPRVLSMLLSHNKVNMRLGYLQEYNLDYSSLHMLCSAKSRFEKFTREGSNKHGTDILIYLSQQLSKPKGALRTKFAKHPFWKQVPSSSIEMTLKFLLNRNYSQDDIFENVQLLLYPMTKVEEELRKLWKQPEIIHGKQYGVHMDKLTSSQCLSFCLYYIEREHHFTGNGVWYTPSPSA